jgi:hypothetical protein
MPVTHQGKGINYVPIDPWILIDGRLNAPSGNPQFPTLLNTYHPAGPADGRYLWPSTVSFNGSTGNLQQPPWHVAGIDYPVGPNIPRASMKDPATITDPGVDMSGAASKAITITGANVTLDGYDLSLATGWNINVRGENFTLSNCYWKATSGGQDFPIGWDGSVSIANGTVKYCEFDGNQIHPLIAGEGLINGMQSSGPTGGTMLIAYNFIHDSFVEGILCGSAVTSGAHIIMQYNMIGNVGYGAAPSGFAIHGDWFQQYCGTTPTLLTLDSFLIQFNTFYQTVPDPTADTQGMSINSANNPNGDGANKLVTVRNNTMVANTNGAGGLHGPVNFGIIIDNTNLNGTASVTQNYGDGTGMDGGSPGQTNHFLAFGAFNNPGDPGFGPYTGVLTSDTGNVNMVDGTTWT